MASSAFAWLKSVWAMLDERLRSLSESLQRVVRLLRLLRAALVVAVLFALASPVVLFLWPRYFPIAYAVSTVMLVVPLVALAFLVALPLKARSVVRLIDQGYPSNAKELAIRVAARKLHDQSIETEELLVDTALNESRKMVDRYRDRARRLKEHLEAMEAEERSAAEAQGGRKEGP